MTPLVLALALLVPPLQEADDAEWQGIVATINGEAITAADVVHQTALMRAAGMLDRATPDEAARQARRMLAEEIMLASEAKRLGVELSEAQVSAHWRRRTGREPDFEASAAAAGIAVDRQIELTRRAALADLYLMHRCGIRSEYAARVAPDLMLSRLVSITPSQLREAFHANRDKFHRPEMIRVHVFPCEHREAAERVIGTLVSTGQPPADARVIDDAFPILSLDEGFSPEVAQFLRTARPGDVSSAFERPEGALVFRVVGRETARTAAFADVQSELRDMLVMEAVGRAREVLVQDLTATAVYWPDDLLSVRVANPPPPP